MKKISICQQVSKFFLAGMLCLTLTACGETEPPASPENLSVSPEPREESTLQAGDLSRQDNVPPQDSVSQSDSASRQPDASDNTSQQSDSSDGTFRQSGASDSQPLESSTPEITLVMVGDILLHTPVAESGLREDGCYDFSAVFSHMKEEISAADLALVNQEVILGGMELGISGYPAFNAPYELGDALVDAGFDVVLHATNHALDRGAKGILNCLDFWEENHPEIAVLGIHDSAEDQDEIYVYEQNGIQIAILNYTYGTNGIPLPQGMDYAVDGLSDLDQIAEDLRQAEEMADFTIVCPHWGTEYRLTQDAGQDKLAQFFWENGADLVLGTHPHVIEPVAWVTAEGIQTCDLTEQETGQGVSLIGNGMQDGMLVYYSLGNFVNWTSGTGEGVADRMVGGMAKVTLGLSEDGNVSIKEYGMEPLICHVEEGIDGVTVYPLYEYTEELAGQNAIRLQDGNFSLRYCFDLVERVW
ncbi:MAG: CapA family protein [Lachnospiraceae bacterium]|nr:CapA family protein [Lachnospiraceae bacterium]MCM1241111.1 CapA family protein [Lachnospiraceae bacterium]